MAKRLAFGLGVLGLVVGSIAASRQASAQTTACTGLKGESYSLGSLALFGSDRYRCLYVYGERVTPSGVGWIKMQANSDRLPKEPSDGR